MNSVKSSLLKVGLLATLGAGLPLAASAQTVTLQAHNAFGPAHTVVDAVFNELNDALMEASNGQMRLQLRHGEVGVPPTQFPVVVQGLTDMAWTLPAYTSTSFPRTLLAELPGIIPEGMAGYEMMWNAWDAGHLADEFRGTVPLALWVSEPAVFIMRERAIRTPEDLRGLRIRSGGAVQSAMIQALGATPVNLSATEMYNALQTGQIDGIITGSSAIQDFRLDEVANYYTTGPSLGQIAFFLVMNQMRYNSLNAQQRAILDEAAGRSLSAAAEAGWNATADAILERLRNDPNKTVIDLSADEAAAFDAITNIFRQNEIQRVANGPQVVADMLGEGDDE